MFHLHVGIILERRKLTIWRQCERFLETLLLLLNSSFVKYSRSFSFVNQIGNEKCLKEKRKYLKTTKPQKSLDIYDISSIGNLVPLDSPSIPVLFPYFRSNSWVNYLKIIILQSTVEFSILERPLTRLAKDKVFLLVPIRLCSTCFVFFFYSTVAKKTTR